jgi:hypothetical protein
VSRFQGSGRIPVPFYGLYIVEGLDSQAMDLSFES